MKKFVQLAHTQEENKTTVMVSIVRNSERRNSDCLTAFGLNSKNMTVGELIESLSKYPKDTKVFDINNIFKSTDGKVVLAHKNTKEEDEYIEYLKQRDRERIEHGHDITCFADRW